MNRKLSSIIFILWLFITGCEEVDTDLAIQAGADAIKASTLDNDEVKRLAKEVIRQSDAEHSVAHADHPYTQRLHRLVGSNDEYDGFTFTCKVYLAPTINAFAMADGTIRIYSGLMDMLDDRELLFVIGHEMGHVVKNHIQKKIMLAYAGSAVRKAIAAQHNQVGEIARSTIGVFTENLLNAQFSQQEEREADDYGVLYMIKNGYDRRPAISTLTKLAALGNDHSFLSSHPAPEDRARRLSNNQYDPQMAAKPSVLEHFWNWLKGLAKERATVA